MCVCCMYVWLKSGTVKTVIIWFLCPLHIKLAVQFWLQMLVNFSFFTVHRRTYYKRRCSKRFSTRTPRGPKNIMQQAGKNPKTGSEMHVACSTVDIFIHFPNNPVFFLLLQAYLLEHLALLKKILTPSLNCSPNSGNHHICYQIPWQSNMPGLGGGDVILWDFRL